MRFPTEILKKCWFIAGPTACGKTATALALTERLPAEIVSLDSMAIYRNMDIGTAKPTAEERRRVPHHLIDVVDPHQDFSVSEYITTASDACHAILARDRVPIFVGGTGLYLRSVLRGVFEGPPADWELRKQLETTALKHGPLHLHQQLAEVDPETAARLHVNDQRRIIRALEVQKITGRPLSAQQQQSPLPADQRPDNVFWISPPRDWLYRRIDHRVEMMITAGLVEEVRNLLAHPQPLSHTARQALGYREIIEYLQGEATLDDTINTIQTRTRQFAKRQHTWFRNLEECHELEITGEESAFQLAERIHQQALGRE